MLAFPLLGLMAASGIWMFVCFARAAMFASRHKARLLGPVERATWWLRLMFVKDGYGAEVEAERRKLALHWLASIVLLFASIGALLLTSPKA